MNYLSVENISKSYADKMLFENITFGIQKGQKVALIAKNGTGKSTIFKLLAKTESLDTGSIVFNNDISVAYLPQEVILDEEKDIISNIFLADNPRTRAIKEYEIAIETNDYNKLETASSMMDQTQAWDYEAKAKQILGKLDIHHMDRLVKNLSGGQKKRIGLAKVLLQEPDFLLLDEPTNHLDLDMIEWLENYFAKTAMTLLMITHDRYFLEVVCDEILELDDGKMFKYTGNFSYFLEKKAEREDMLKANLDKAQNLMRRELKWIRSTPKARTGKSKYRQEQFVGLKSRASVNLDDDNLSLQINTKRLGSKILEIHKISKSYPEVSILNSFSYVFKRQERIGIVGNNGTGKTTLLDIFTGKTSPDSGKVVIGETISFGYYSQKGLKIKDDQRVIEAVRDIADLIPLKGGKKITAEQMLERFLFPRSMHRNLISKLSGGEKKRLYLLTILMKNPNFLILDEPTNDLDIFTLSVLEDYLLQFPGILVVVSHDRYFMDKLVDHLFVLEGDGKLKDFPGNYSQWREKEDLKPKAILKSEKKKKSQKSEKKETKTKLSFNEKFEFDQLEKEIPDLEIKKKELEAKMNSGILTNHEELLELSTELGELIDDLDQKSERWLELAEFA